MKADFILIGAQKSGTTSLASQLAAHPEICFSKIKEPGYFNMTDDWRSGLTGYHDLFDPQPGQLCGEASTMYTFLPEWQNTHRRLYQYNPELKLIYIMRQPVKRLISHYNHNLVRTIEKANPQEAVFSDPCYINRSRYAVQIRPYLELFGRQNIMLLIFEDYIADQHSTLRRIADFLDISFAEFDSLDTTPQHQTAGASYLKYSTMRKWTNTETFQSLRAFVPASIRQPIRNRIFANRLDQPLEFSPELKDLIWQLLVDDVMAVEEILGHRIERWHQASVK